ncbi:Putative AC transposase [Linum grandiflorum]
MLSRVKNNVPIIRYINLLAIPITSVASEAAFSSGGRLLDPHRSRLDPSTVEAMMRARSWIQDEGRGGKLLKFSIASVCSIFYLLFCKCNQHYLCYACFCVL